ncbi:hypothetical protein CGC53_06185 [Capnocytophaga leadbetteri]|uniref:DUF4279 domain-containing protein n=1 Tax=Capnocytophaga leadbetteri TaxID=327575 RepID=A0A250FA14_9FLAO|nr:MULTISPECIES: hypothetical protein [Capnocytophaga]ATA81964.1 hypothetical protein CGC53_06185 [Capnocytophaga leadbetteri]MBB1569926.1 hypothetical protein [Capnocytophaga sp.]
MIAYYFNIEIFGTELLIDEILKILGNKIKIGKIIHPNDENKKGEKYGFGCIRLSHPKVYIADDELVDYLSWLSDFIKEYFDIFDTLGMEEVWFVTNIYYTDSFLSLELFDSDFFKQTASYKISIPMNIYKETEQEIIEMLRNRPY